MADEKGCGRIYLIRTPISKNGFLLCSVRLFLIPYPSIYAGEYLSMKVETKVSLPIAKGPK